MNVVFPTQKIIHIEIWSVPFFSRRACGKKPKLLKKKASTQEVRVPEEERGRAEKKGKVGVRHCCPPP